MKKFAKGAIVFAMVPFILALIAMGILTGVPLFILLWAFSALDESEYAAEGTD